MSSLHVVHDCRQPVAQDIRRASFCMTEVLARLVPLVSHFSRGFTVYRAFLIAINLHLA